MSKPKNQHWVPQFYLRHFATQETYLTDEPKVWIFSKDEQNGDEKVTNIKNICAKRYLYSPQDANGHRSWRLETKLGKAENVLAKIWDDLAEDFVNLGEESIRKGLALFIATLHLRHPDTLKQTTESHQNIIDFCEQAPMGVDGVPEIEAIEINGKIIKFDADGWHDYRRWKKKDHHRFFVDFIQFNAVPLAELLMRKRWSIITSESNQFITTDKPVCIQHKTKKVFGFGTHGVLVFFPISQKRLLCMDDMHDQPKNQYYALDKNSIGAHNYILWKNSKKFMISGRPII